MSFEDALLNIANRVQDYAGSLETEEATKNAIIMPFIQSVLGYDVFNPDEVVPEFVADVGSRKAEKIDYAIKREESIQRGLFIGVFRVFKGGVSLSRVAACS